MELFKRGGAGSVALVVGLVALLVSTWTAFSASGSWNDDAYIFFQYAKNLASGNGLAFNPGEVSFGVTSVLWALVLGLFSWITGLEALTAAKILCIVLFAASGAFLGGLFVRWTQNLLLGLLAGVLCAVHPVLVFEAVSGMEVSLNLFLLVLLVYLFFVYGSTRFWVYGLLIGLMFLTRPENVLWLPAFVFLSFAYKGKKWTRLTGLFLGFAILALPWEIYLYAKTSLLLPPTREGKLLLFFPKHYGMTLEQFRNLGLFERLKAAVETIKWLLQIKTALVFFPFLLLVGYFVWKEKIRPTPFGLALAGYAAGLAVLFVFFFPMIKLRYFVHLYPLLIFISVLACYHLWQVLRQRSPIFRSVFWYHLGGAVLIAFIPLAGLLAARKFSRLSGYEDVRVQVASWFKAHTPPGSRIALEPIGAIGYHSDRPIVDLGGLVDPEAWPFLKNGMDSSPDSLLIFLKKKKVNYIVDYGFHPWLGKVADAFPEKFMLVAQLRFPEIPEPENDYDIFKLRE